ncbi:hypothetical protein [Rhodobacter ferrooxidans]|uniref:Antifreeze glycopeptide polyprotein n=1 Tax=Rhodobacter ferrooxidans TaxID=371731 RepID=C8RZ68_9RHOB|nr:hypothetical protein [Rhodobacter sp. SW2]EEW26025.1 conserved hypothetical protein [Rhodobacter sp. SW2]
MPIKPGPWQVAVTLALLAAAPARAEAPLSAIDWLSQSVATPAASTAPPEPAVALNGLPQDVTVTVLDAPAPDAVGLLPARVTGLPRALWGMGRTADIAALITRQHAEALPALQSLLITLLLAEADPPVDAGGKGDLLLTRIDKLLDIGALEQAAALLQASGAATVDLFRRAFDVALLTGSEDQACAAMQATPDLAPTFTARIFCLARAGDWNAAALTLQTGKALALITPAEAVLLTRFLDTTLDEGATDLPQPEKPTPLVWRLFEAIGQPLATAPLPLAFSNADLSETAGLKAQIEAAERLARVGAIAPNQLLGIYTLGAPAASGGVWDRVEAFQRFDAALTKADAPAVAQHLPLVWAQMAEAELEVPFATLYTDALLKMQLEGEAGAIAFRVALLSSRYEQAARARAPADATEAFLIGLARGSLQGVAPPDSMARAIAPAFLQPQPAADALAMLAEDRLGEAVLAAIDRIGRGVEGDLRGVTEGLALLRHVGLEDVARRTALELMLLERRG